ncbi:MAG: condensation domain-containing protein [Rhodococcus sp. (in: high G+C Gram-positive bacteria)]
MEFTELAEYPLPAGQLTEWVPTVSSKTSWRVDHRPLAYTHEAHCRHSLAAAAAGSDSAAWIGAIFEIHERHDADAMRRALCSWTSRHETFRTTVSTAGVGDPGSVRLVRSTAAKDAVDVVPQRRGRFETGARVHRHVVDFFDRALSPFVWPHCVVATIDDICVAEESADDRFLIAFGADHSVMDAYSMLLAVSELRRLYEYELHGRDPGLGPAGSHVDFSVIDRRTGDGLTADHEVVLSWSRFLNGEQFPDFPLPVAPSAETTAATTGPCDPGSDRQSGLSTVLLDAQDTAELAVRSRRQGASMTAALVGAMALATKELTESPRLRFVMPMHTRFEPRFAESVGWYVGVVPMDVHLDHDSDYREATRRAGAALSSVEGYARQPYSRVAELLRIESVPSFVVSYLDLRHTPDSESWPLWNTRTLRSSTVSRNEVYFWILRTPLGLGISARFPANAVAATSVHTFVSRCRDILHTAATGPDTRDPAVPGSARSVSDSLRVVTA